MPQNAKSKTPLTAAELNILLALADREQHGYAIMQEINGRTKGRFRLGPGTLYGTIKRLLRGKLISQGAERVAPSLNDERRRYYQLTASGRHVLSGEVQRLAQIVSIARKKHVFPAPLSATTSGGGA